jgi:hypothetical protein
MKEPNYNGYYADCYVLCENRDEKFIIEFLNFFIPEREESSDEYEYPQYDTNSKLYFENVDKLIKHLIINNTSEYSIYWRNKKKDKLRGAMLFFTEDGKLIIGLYCDTLKNDSKIEDDYLIQLKEFSKSKFGYIAYEEITEMNTYGFMKMVEKDN